MSQIKAVLFDLDGTLLLQDLNEQMKRYFTSLIRFVSAGRPVLAAALVQNIMAATEKAIVNEDETATISDIFWREYCLLTGVGKADLHAYFEQYYDTHYDELGAGVLKSEQIQMAVALCKKRGFRQVVATNPLFPLSAQRKRIRWAGLDPDDFELITDYETMHFAKPNPRYFQEIADLLGLKPEQCAMVGNHGVEDMIAGSIGMKTFLLLGYEMSHEGYAGESGDALALLRWLEKL